MASDITPQNRIIHNAPRNLITQHHGVSATATAAGGNGVFTVITASGFTPALTTHLKVRRVVYNISVGCQVRVQWDATTPVDIAVLSGFGDYDINDGDIGSQGIQNDAGAGVTGNILANVAFPTANAYPGLPGAYNIFLFMTKGQ